MKCSFCGTESKELYFTPEDIGLCDECKKVYCIINGKENSELHRIEEDNEGADAYNVPGILCAIYTVMDTDKKLSYRIEGSDVDLPRLEGLVDYLKRVIDRLYQDKI